VHIIGHWTYPEKTTKTVYVAATHCDRVELILNGKSLGVSDKPAVFVDSFNGLNLGDTGFIYAFPNVAFLPGTLKAVATRDGAAVASEELRTAGEPRAIRLTVHAGPGGLQADGSDVALVDFEVVDALGNRCPTDEARVDFAVEGPAVWRGGINSRALNSTNNLYLYTECGINRVAIRSTLAPGTIKLRATREGLAPASVDIVSHPAEITDGIGAAMPHVYHGLAEAIPGLVP
jgi:beta-galactosidase